jgi:GTP cyclohydrolase FolE2
LDVHLYTSSNAEASSRVRWVSKGEAPVTKYDSLKHDEWFDVTQNGEGKAGAFPVTGIKLTLKVLTYCQRVGACVRKPITK